MKRIIIDVTIVKYKSYIRPKRQLGILKDVRAPSKQAVSLIFLPKRTTRIGVFHQGCAFTLFGKLGVSW